MTFETLGTAGGKWLWDQFGKQIVEKAFGDIKRKWEEFQWDDAQILYLMNMRDQHNTTRLLGYPKPIKIDETFTDVYILDLIGNK